MNSLFSDRMSSIDEFFLRCELINDSPRFTHVAFIYEYCMFEIVWCSDPDLYINTIAVLFDFSNGLPYVSECLFRA